MRAADRTTPPSARPRKRPVAHMGPRMVLAVVLGAFVLTAVPSARGAVTPGYTVTKDVPFMPFTTATGGSDTLKVDVYTPSTPPPPGGYPTMVTLHGARNVSDKGSAAFEAGVFADHGYLALAPDYRLACDPTDPPPRIDRGLCGFYYPTEQTDVAFFINWARDPSQVSTYAVDPNHLGVFGTSAGANLAMLMGTGLPDWGLNQLPQVVVQLSGEVQMYDYMYSPQPDLEVSKDQVYFQCQYGTGDPACDAEYHKASPYDSAGPGDSPMYLANGKYEHIPLATAQNLATALTASSVPNYLRVAPGVSHGSNMEDDVIAGCCATVMDEAVAYADTYLMPNPTADLTVSGSTTPAAPVSSGAPLTYDLTVTNDGPEFATGATLTDHLPAGLTFLSASTSQGSCTGTTTVVCPLGDLPAFTPVTLAIRATPTAPASYTNTPTVSLSRGPASDPTSSNDSVSFTATAVSQVNADMALTMKAKPKSLKANANLTYTLTATNKGPGAVNTVTVSDSLPPGVPLLSASPSQGSCAGSTTVVCTLGTLGQGQSATVGVVVTPPVIGTIVNNATVSANGVDATASNDSASVSTTVNKAIGYVYASVIDTGFSSGTVTTTEGGAVQWYLLPQGPGPGPGSGTDTWGHSATEAGGFSTALFDSGILDPSGSYAYRFTAAGAYTVNDVVTNVDQTVQVGLNVAPKSGTHATTFAITWAKQAASAGFVYDVQLKKPGGLWTDWAPGVTAPSASFTPAPTDPTGKYMFRARLRSTSGGGVTGYSKGTPITVN